MAESTVQQLLLFLHKAERLKSISRHCVTSEGTAESVAGHSWRMALMAYLIETEIPEADMGKVIKMCLIHDLGEAVTGDIPIFQKTKRNEETEKEELDRLIKMLPICIYEEWKQLFQEMEAMETLEAKICKSLDRMEAVIQHNESDIKTWLPLEYELQKNYGTQDARCHPYLKKMREQVRKDTEEKIEKNTLKNPKK